MGKSKIIFIGLAFLIGTAFMLTGLSLYGVINNGASLWDGLSKPAHWIYGAIFGIILALGAWMSRKGRKQGRIDIIQEVAL